jgi:hypothetical protein
LSTGTTSLGVVGLQRVERGEQGAAVEHVQAGVDLADRELLGGRVAGDLGLGDPLDGSVAVADHAPVAGRVVELHRGERGGGVQLVVRGDGGRDRLARDQRHVAVHDDDGRAGVDAARRGGDGVAGPARLLLDHGLDAVGQVLGEQPLGVVDDDHPRRPGLACREQRPLDQRPPADRVQDLGQRGAHPGPLTRGEDDHGRGWHGVAS